MKALLLVELNECRFSMIRKALTTLIEESSRVYDRKQRLSIIQLGRQLGHDAFVHDVLQSTSKMSSLSDISSILAYLAELEDAVAKDEIQGHYETALYPNIAAFRHRRCDVAELHSLKRLLDQSWMPSMTAACSKMLCNTSSF
jgi:hypothetical protein